MGELEPRDSRIVTQNPSATPIEPERTGPREAQTRPESEGDAPRGEASDAEADRWQVSEEGKRRKDAPNGG